MKSYLNILILVVICFLISCSEHLIEKKGKIVSSYVVPGVKGIGFRDYARISFENEGRIDTISVQYKTARLNKGDSVLFSWNVKRPSKSKLKRVLFRHNESEVVIPITRSTKKLYQYHTLDTKPLFKGAANFHENDSIIQHYLRKELLQVQDSVSGRIVIYLLIETDGKVSVEDILLADQLTKDNLKSIVNRMPLFEPGKQKGENVKVSYLVELK